ncbi:sigma-70 family RNA polymerase sigma factor [Clostridium isatidis]|uniref:sigma-70 family RNA polymerase sigma factor n=1 Tax=Clostridium isatidis TaxID=182773 RepID=UPI003AADF55C
MKKLEDRTHVWYNVNIKFEGGDEFMKELLIKAKQGDKVSMEKLLNKFEPLIKKSSKQYYINGYEQGDIKQLAYMATLKAIKRFDLEKSNSFPLYVKRTVQNSIYKEIKKSKEIISYNKGNRETKENSEIKNIEDKNVELEEEIIKKERREKLINLINKMANEEKEFIREIFIEEKSLKEYAKEKGLKYHQVVYFKKKVLQKIEIKVGEGVAKS